MVAVPTAAFVLLFNVYCACGGAGAHDGGSCRVTVQLVEEKPVGHCHGHAAGADGSGESDQDPRHHESGGCRHCHAAPRSIERNETGQGLSPGVALDFQPLPAAWMPTRAAAPGLIFAVDLPPPQGAPTLLSLHCALNT